MDAKEQRLLRAYKASPTPDALKNLVRTLRRGDKNSLWELVGILKTTGHVSNSTLATDLDDIFDAIMNESLSESLNLPASTQQALTPTVIPKDSTTGLTREAARNILSGKGSLILVPDGVTPKADITTAMRNVLSDVQSIKAWERLFLKANSSKSSGLYVMDKRGNFYRVKDVILDPDGETGEMRVMGVGRAGRGRGTIMVDPEEHVGAFVPVVSYRSVPKYLQIESTELTIKVGHMHLDEKMSKSERKARKKKYLKRAALGALAVGSAGLSYKATKANLDSKRAVSSAAKHFAKKDKAAAWASVAKRATDRPDVLSAKFKIKEALEKMLSSNLSTGEFEELLDSLVC